jgi:hypothetical protein
MLGGALILSLVGAIGILVALLEWLIGLLPARYSAPSSPLEEPVRPRLEPEVQLARMRESGL